MATKEWFEDRFGPDERIVGRRVNILVQAVRNAGPATKHYEQPLVAPVSSYVDRGIQTTETYADSQATSVAAQHASEQAVAAAVDEVLANDPLANAQQAVDEVAGQSQLENAQAAVDRALNGGGQPSVELMSRYLDALQRKPGMGPETT
jgi:hypothetical protein